MEEDMYSDIKTFLRQYMWLMFLIVALTGLLVVMNFSSSTGLKESYEEINEVYPFIMGLFGSGVLVGVLMVIFLILFGSFQKKGHCGVFSNESAEERRKEEIKIKEKKQAEKRKENMINELAEVKKQLSLLDNEIDSDKKLSLRWKRDRLEKQISE